MATQYFDTVFEDELDGEITEVLVTDKDNTPNHVIQKDALFDIAVSWHVFGDGADMLGGTWNVQLNLESMGSGSEGTIATMAKLYTNVEAGSTPTDCKWKVDFVDLADPFPADPDGVYKLIVLITFLNPLGHPRSMAGSIEGPLITFYTAN